MNFEKIKGKISSILEQTKNKVNEVKDKNQLKTMIERAVEDGELTEEEKNHQNKSMNLRTIIRE